MISTATTRPKSPPRVLFLRAHGKLCSYSLIVNGLCHAQNLEFAQYPPLPPQSQAELQKLGYREQAWQDFQTNLIPSASELTAQLHRKSFDIVLLADYDGDLSRYAQMPWWQRFKTLLSLLRRKPRQFMTNYRYLTAFPYSIQELCQRVPVIVADLTDPLYLRSSTAEQLRHCRVYFKREVPYNRFVLFHALFPANQLSRAQKDPQLIALLPKIQPIPLGIPDVKWHALLLQRTAQQDIDIFWSGRISSTMRAAAKQRLKELTGQTAWNIVMPETPLSFAEYCQTAARSKVTISVEGGG
jgi:hypothetical protein